MKRLVPLALMLSLAAAGAQAQTGALTYPSVARDAPRTAAPATPTARTPAVTVTGERLRADVPRASTEPVYGVFVYERLGATPRVLLPMRERAMAEVAPTVAQR